MSGDPIQSYEYTYKSAKKKKFQLGLGIGGNYATMLLHKYHKYKRDTPIPTSHHISLIHTM